MSEDHTSVWRAVKTGTIDDVQKIHHNCNDGQDIIYIQKNIVCGVSGHLKCELDRVQHDVRTRRGL
jgi:hypothetical protein